MAHVRRFHLAKAASAFPQGPAGGVRKVKRAGKTSVALLFEEIKSQAEKVLAKKGDDRDGVAEQSSGTPRKRPNTKGGKMIPRGRDSNGAPSILPTPQEKDRLPEGPADLGPAKFSELPDWAQDLLAEQLGSVALDKGERSPKPLKIKPKAPALRYRDRHPDYSDEMTDAPEQDSSRIVEDDMDYVYDTYVREPRQSMLNDENFGLLVVDDETQTAWETLEDTELSDIGEAEEEEDENGQKAPVLVVFPTSNPKKLLLTKRFHTAENYYANDYPDEEEEGGEAYSVEEEDEDEDVDDEGSGG